MTRDFVWGVLGAAKIGEKVVPALQAGAGMRVGAIASRDEGRARADAERYGVAKAYGAYEALLADPEIDGVYNPLPNDLHVSWSIRAMEAGKHVLCEKPIALTAAEAERLREAQVRTGRLVVEAFMVRHHPQWIEARERVRSGALGELRAIQTAFSFYNDDPTNIRNRPENGGGGLYDIGCYAINTARFLFEAEPERVIGLFDMDPQMGVDRLTSGLMLFSGGRQASFVCSTQLVPTQRVTILGTQARLVVEVPFNAPPDRDLRIVEDPGTDLFGEAAQATVLPATDQYARQAEAFVARVAAGGGADTGPIEDAIANMRVIDALFRSRESGALERVG
ncbi:Gfo/Idh/MocA family oxidoreductase [Salinarimonas sp.]|uniref:Gfo/Idh/MocA family protein n=1 Tax=Salinarimonas sp. TaxID=2766526 RepID=UPI0032D99219